MEALAARIAAFVYKKHYIEPDQIAWLQYGSDAPPNGNGYISSSASSRCIFGRMESTFAFFCWSSASFVCGQADTMLKNASRMPFLGSTFTMIVSLEFCKEIASCIKSNLSCCFYLNFLRLATSK